MEAQTRAGGHLFFSQELNLMNSSSVDPHYRLSLSFRAESFSSEQYSQGREVWPSRREIVISWAANTVGELVPRLAFWSKTRTGALPIVTSQFQFLAGQLYSH
jgi:hypothetical protein